MQTFDSNFIQSDCVSSSRTVHINDNFWISTEHKFNCSNFEIAASWRFPSSSNCLYFACRAGPDPLQFQLAVTYNAVYMFWSAFWFTVLKFLFQLLADSLIHLRIQQPREIKSMVYLSSMFKQQTLTRHWLAIHISQSSSTPSLFYRPGRSSCRELKPLNQLNS
jgi:hypothetical protein